MVRNLKHNQELRTLLILLFRIDCAMLFIGHIDCPSMVMESGYWISFICQNHTLLQYVTFMLQRVVECEVKRGLNLSGLLSLV